jgi:rhodanese-related sulfurtransferase
MSATLTTFLLIAAMAAFFTAVAADGKSAPQNSAVTERAPAPRPAYKNVNPDEFDKLRQNKTNVVLDVRTKKEYQEAHLPGAILIDITGDDFDQEIAKLDKNKTYLVHCAAGGRSSRACKKMEALGFKNLYNLEGGMTAWQKAGKPVEK